MGRAGGALLENYINDLAAKVANGSLDKEEAIALATGATLVALKLAPKKLRSKLIASIKNPLSKLTNRFRGAPNRELLWGSWNDYPKVTVNGREYAQIGNRQYTRHAIDRMQPSGLGAPAGADRPGRNVTPNMVEDVIANGTSTNTTVNGISRTIYSGGNVSVVTENGGRTIVTILRNSSQ